MRRSPGGKNREHIFHGSFTGRATKQAQDVRDRRSRLDNAVPSCLEKKSAWSIAPESTLNRYKLAQLGSHKGAPFWCGSHGAPSHSLPAELDRLPTL